LEMAKDLFSDHSETYARYRPAYPKQLFEYITGYTILHERAWDCATGNGQAAIALSRYFKTVDATDISASQIKNAIKQPNINYSICSAEQSPFQENSFDLITVAQAYHWLNWEQFFKEATRVGKAGCVVAIWTYGLLTTDENELNQLIKHFYSDIVGSYWDKERRYVEEEYKTVDFDFDPLPGKEFSILADWNKDELTGYLESWSSVQHYKNRNLISPLQLIKENLERIWKDSSYKSFRFRVFLRLGRVIK
jgi:ubiquinone/menaquinone biosynthesis C-methylase UbiE